MLSFGPKEVVRVSSAALAMLNSGLREAVKASSAAPMTLSSGLREVAKVNYKKLGSGKLSQRMPALKVYLTTWIRCSSRFNWI